MHSHGSYGEMACRDSRISRNARVKETDLQWKNNKERLSQRRWRGKTAIWGCPLTVAHTQRYAWPLFSLPASHTEIRKISLPSILENPKGRKLQSGFQRRLWEKGPGTVSHRSLQSTALLLQLYILTWCRDRALCCLSLLHEVPSSALHWHVLVNSAKSCRFLRLHLWMMWDVCVCVCVTQHTPLCLQGGINKAQNWVCLL